MPIPPLNVQKKHRFSRETTKGPSPHKQGKDFEREVSASLRFCEENLPNFMWRRFFDTRDYVKINRYLQVPHQPSDYWIVYNGTPYFLEAKSSRVPTRYRADNVKEDQLKDLLRAEQCGGRSIILFCRRVIRDNRTFAMSASVFNALKLEAEEDGKKSIPWTKIKECGTEVRLQTGKIWDLRPLFS